MPNAFSRAGAALLLLAATPAVQAPMKQLGEPTARLNHPLSSVAGFRELSDGRVMVSDGIDQVVLVADLAQGRLDTLGRSGQGPGEYRTPDALFGTPNGGTLLVDLGNGRLTWFGPDGSYQESTPIAQGSPGSPDGLKIVVPQGIDRQGRLYYEALGPRTAGPEAMDSAAVLRWDRARRTLDTLAKVRRPSVTTRSSGTANNRNVSQQPRPYSPQDRWAVAPDGRLALVRAPQYRVDWVLADRKLQSGKLLPYQPVPVGTKEKEEFLAEQASAGLAVAVENRNGNVTMTFARGTRGDNHREALEGYQWAESKPPADGPNVAAPDGRLWVARSVAAGAPRLYDVIGPAGELVMQVALPAGRRLVGVGQRSIYLRRVDENDVNWLERYGMP